MKIMQVIPYFCFGGAETMCENLTYALMEQGHQVTVVSLFGDRTPISQRMEAAGVKLIYLDKKMGLDVSMVPKLVRVMKAERPEVVHTHLDVIKYAVAAAKITGVKKCIHTVHNVAEEEAEGLAQKLINKFYFSLGWSSPVALSPKVQKTILDFYGLPENRVPVIFNGIDLSRCHVKSDYTAGDPVTLIHVGRFNHQKNHRGLLDAFSMLLQQQPDCRLRLLGDGELREETEAYARELGIWEKVDFLGSQSNVYPFLHDADVFLLPSHFEGMPMTIIEAMGTGLPVVASQVGGVPDMLRQDVSGLLVPCDAKAVCDACARLVQDQELRRKLGENARTDSERFSAGYMARRYCEEYAR